VNEQLEKMFDEMGLGSRLKDEHKMSGGRLWDIHREYLAESLRLYATNPDEGKKKYEIAALAKKALMRREVWEQK